MAPPVVVPSRSALSAVRRRRWWSAVAAASLACAAAARCSLAWLSLSTSSSAAATSSLFARRRLVAASLAAAALQPAPSLAVDYKDRASVNRPDLLPKTPGASTPIIDIEGILPEATQKLILKDIERIEKVTGVRVRVLTQSYPETPGSAIRDYWKVDDRTLVYVHDTGGLVLTQYGKPTVNLNIGQSVSNLMPSNYWNKLKIEYGKAKDIRAIGDTQTIVNIVSQLRTDLLEAGRVLGSEEEA